jgi:hypothetical protein
MILLIKTETKNSKRTNNFNYFYLLKVNRMTVPLYKHMGYTGVVMQSLYATSLLKNEQTSFLLTLKLVGITALKSPSSYVEIEFPLEHFGEDPMRGSQTYTFDTGKQSWNKCYLADESKIESNIHIPTGANPNDERKKASCIYIPGKTSLPGRSALLRIEGMNSQGNDKTISVSIEDIYLPDESGLFLSLRARVFNFGSTTTERYSLNIPFLAQTIRKTATQPSASNSLAFTVADGASGNLYQKSVWKYTTDEFETSEGKHFYRFDFNPGIFSHFINNLKIIKLIGK